ncbi:cation transporter [Yimella sp. cx-573]|nr:cation transporter [Yimella sp. cx-573]
MGGEHPLHIGRATDIAGANSEDSCVGHGLSLPRLLVNLIALLLLRDGAAESLNVRGAYLEVVADTVGSLGVLVAGALIAFTGNAWWDTAVALAISVFVAVRAVMLGREVLSVLGQHAPAGVEPTEMLAALGEVDGVTDVHDQHVWTLTSGMDVATARLVRSPEGSADEVLAAAALVLRERFDIAHATLQLETKDGACTSTDW